MNTSSNDTPPTGTRAFQKLIAPVALFFLALLSYVQANAESNQADVPCSKLTEIRQSPALK